MAGQVNLNNVVFFSMKSVLFLCFVSLHIVFLH